MWVLLLELRSPRGGGAGAPVIIRWGGEASTDRLRARARCTACGGKGASLRHPSWTDSAGGWANVSNVARVNGSYPVPMLYLRAEIRLAS